MPIRRFVLHPGTATQLDSKWFDPGGLFDKRLAEIKDEIEVVKVRFHDNSDMSLRRMNVFKKLTTPCATLLLIVRNAG